MARRIPPRHQNKPKIRVKVKIKKDDTVKIIAGRDRGKTGRVLQVDAVKGRVLIEGVSMVKRHTRPNPQKQIKGGIAERESSIAISNVMVMTAGGVATRVGYRVEGDHTVRVAKKGGELLDKK
jgi:large subunit ribosomal protein L24